MSLWIKNREIGAGQVPYVIAELSANHNGSIKNALKAIEKAKECGADAVKLQTYTADTMTIDSDLPDFKINNGLWNGFKLYDLYKWAETPFEWMEELFDHGKTVGITVFSTPFDETAVDLLESLDAPAYKIASFEAVDLPLIRYISKTNKPIIMSTGLCSELEIEEAVQTARESGCNDLVLLHCTSSYPAPINQSNIQRIPELAKRFNVPVGLSDHTIGNIAASVAVSLGAVIVEKHFTLDKTEDGPDSAFSAEPSEFKDLCANVRSSWDAIGTLGFDRPLAEKDSRVFRRSIYFVRDLKAGDTVTINDIRRIRPGYGLHPKYFDDLIGKTINTDVYRGTATDWTYFNDSFVDVK